MDEDLDRDRLLEGVLDMQRGAADGLMAAADAARRMAAELGQRTIIVPGSVALLALAKELAAAADQRVLAVTPAAGSA
jgi:hypothetical protein